jgi:hypothetical protein
VLLSNQEVETYWPLAIRVKPKNYQKCDLTSYQKQYGENPLWELTP